MTRVIDTLDVSGAASAVLGTAGTDPEDVNLAARCLLRHARSAADFAELLDVLGLGDGPVELKPLYRSGRKAGYARRTAGKARP